MEQTNATQNTFTQQQVWTLGQDIVRDLEIELLEIKTNNGINYWEVKRFTEYVLPTKVRAILCTLNNDAYENIVKVVRDKLNLNDLFDNRHKYLN